MTEREQNALDFIRTYINEHRFSPSYDEIAEHIGLKSKSGINRIVGQLERKGFVVRNYGKQPKAARCIELVKDPWKQVGDAAEELLASIKTEYVNDATGEGTVLVDAKALGNLDVALAEAREEMS